MSSPGLPRGAVAETNGDPGMLLPSSWLLATRLSPSAFCPGSHPRRNRADEGGQGQEEGVGQAQGGQREDAVAASFEQDPPLQGFRATDSSWGCAHRHPTLAEGDQKGLLTVPKPGFSWNNNSASESWLLGPRVTITAACIPSKSIHVRREVGGKRDVPASALILPSCWGRHLIFGTRTSGSSSRSAR